MSRRLLYQRHSALVFRNGKAERREFFAICQAHGVSYPHTYLTGGAMTPTAKSKTLPGGLRTHGCRLSNAWSYQGAPALILENELLRVTLLTGHGTHISEFRYKPLDLDVLYHDPAGLLPDQRDPALPGDYVVGWQEALPSGGAPAEVRGAPYGAHGELARAAWTQSVLEDTPQRVSVQLTTRLQTIPLLLEKRLSLEPGKAVLVLEERLTNEAGIALHVMWGQRISLGGPFLEEGAVIDAPASQVIAHEKTDGYAMRRYIPGLGGEWPRLKTPQGDPVDASHIPAHGKAKVEELIYLTGLQEGWVALTNPQRQVGFGLSFDPALFRFIWHLEQLGEFRAGFPWWRRAHYTSLEPWTSFPAQGLEQAIRNHSALKLGPGEQRYTRLAACIYTGIQRVAGISSDGEVTPRAD